MEYWVSPRFNGKIKIKTYKNKPSRLSRRPPRAPSIYLFLVISPCCKHDNQSDWKLIKWSSHNSFVPAAFIQFVRVYLSSYYFMLHAAYSGGGCPPSIAQFSGHYVLSGEAQHRALSRYQGEEIKMFHPPEWESTHHRRVYSRTLIPNLIGSLLIHHTF